MRAPQRASYVVDASVVVKWYVPEALSDRADALLDRLEAAEVTLLAPDLLWVEVASAVCKKHRRRELQDEDVRQIYRRLARLPIRAVAVRELLADAVEIAMSAGCTTYDALYIALAQREHLPLLTADDRLVRGLATTQLEGVATSLRDLHS